MVSLAEFELRDGVYFERGAPGAPSSYREQWEREAGEDHVLSAIARPAPDETLEQLTAKLTPVWERIPAGAGFGTILDLGCGYGRLALALSRRRDVRCETYVGVDISETMLRHLLRYWTRYDVFPGAQPVLVCTSAHALPLPDDSVDLAVSSALFLHMGRRYVASALAETARVLRPGGDFIFEGSFPNRLGPANLPSLLGANRADRRPNRLKYWTRGELESLLARSGLVSKSGGYAVEAADRAVLPKSVGGRRVPLARRLNALAGRAGGRIGEALAVTFTVRSERLGL